MYLVRKRPRRLVLIKKKLIKQQINDCLSKSIFRSSYSEYANLLVLVKKKDGSRVLLSFLLVCVDYRKITEKVMKDEHLLPVTDDNIDTLSREKYSDSRVKGFEKYFFHLSKEEASRS